MQLRLTSLTVTSSREDLQLQECAHAGRTKKPLQPCDCSGLRLAEWTGLEPATPGVTGRYSNQLNYHSWQAAFTCIYSTQAKRYNLATLRGFEPRYSP